MYAILYYDKSKLRVGNYIFDTRRQAEYSALVIFLRGQIVKVNEGLFKTLAGDSENKHSYRRSPVQKI